LLEGVPGLGKTMLLRTLADAIDVEFSRVQFTPDLMPADIVGTQVLEPTEGGGREFRFRAGPVFANLVLADEVNRATPKTQSAMLEAMQERSVTVGGVTRELPRPFLVMATQNPLEMEGTYPLPEAQLDRFLLHVQVGYPTPADERRILVLNRDEAKAGERDAFRPPELLQQATIMEARQQILNLHLADELEEYIVNIVVATRDPGVVNEALAGQVLYGASPRACMAIDRCARARAWLQGRDYVGPDDIQHVAPDILRHRLVLSFEAEADGIDPDSVIQGVLDGVGVP
jgi:MoxR-like ATPase